MLSGREETTPQSCPAIITAERDGYNEVAGVISSRPLSSSFADFGGEIDIGPRASFGVVWD